MPGWKTKFLADQAGQVIVIGATNRPDSVDPALRRPGRFDREFYFPLPNKEARKKIIQINTKKWTPQLDEGMVEMLAGMTKGYGGADMRVSFRVMRYVRGSCGTGYYALFGVCNRGMIGLGTACRLEDGFHWTMLILSGPMYGGRTQRHPKTISTDI